MSVKNLECLERRKKTLFNIANPHTGPYECDECEMQFLRKRLLSRHISRGQCYETFLSVICVFSYLARVFVRQDWKSLPMTNTLAYYENS
jgi:hypothetical protein